MGNNKKTGSGGLKIPDQLFTFASFSTLGGCVVIAWIVTSVLCSVFELSSGPTGLIVAIIVALVAVLLSAERQFKNYVVAIFNGFLIYLTIVGGTAFTPLVNPRTPEDVSKPGIFKPWIPDKNFVKENVQQKEAIMKFTEKSVQQEEALKKVETDLESIDQAITQAPTLPDTQKKVLSEKLRTSRKFIFDTRKFK
jgi:hypothetical protein